MATPVNIKDSDSGTVAKVTKYGQLVVAPIQYSTPASDLLLTVSTAFNFITPEQGSSIVITDIVASAANSVSASAPADVILYTADSPTSTTIIDVIVEPQVFRGTNFTLTGLNLLVDEGVWVNAQTNDAIIAMTVMYYRVPAGDI